MALALSGFYCYGRSGEADGTVVAFGLAHDVAGAIIGVVLWVTRSGTHASIARRTIRVEIVLHYRYRLPIVNRSKHPQSRAKHNTNFLTLWPFKSHPPATSKKSLLDLIAIQQGTRANPVRIWIKPQAVLRKAAKGSNFSSSRFHR